MPKMRLALVAAEFLPNWGGAGTYNVRLVKHLKDEVEIHVITPRRRIRGSSDSYSADELEAMFDHKVKVHYIADAADTFVYNARFQLAVRSQLHRLHQQYHFDLVHTDHPHMADILCRAEVPKVTTVHTTIVGHLAGIRQSKLGFRQIESSERYQIMLGPFLRLTERSYLSKLGHVITVSQWMKRELEQDFHKAQVDVVYSGVESDVFLPQNGRAPSILPKVDVPIVLFTSRMTAAKGAHFLIRSMPRIIKENDKVHFAFAGSELEQPWKSMLEEQKVDPKYYSFLGYLPYEQLPSLYSRASIYVCPSLCENLPARILEAMSCEVPVVATSIYGMPEAIENDENGLLVPPGDEDALADAILRLLNDPLLRQRLGKRARRTVRDKFDWRNLAQQTKGVYERVVLAR